VVIVGLVALVAVAAYHFGPWLLNERTFTSSTPVGFPFTEPPQEIALAPGGSACVRGVGLRPSDEVAVVQPRTHGRPAVPLELRVTAPGHRAAAVVRDYGDEEAVTVPVDPPAGDTLGTVCVRNLGRRTVWMTGTREPRAASIQAKTTVDGRRIEPDLSLRFDERGRRSMLARLSDGFERLALWKPGIVGVPLLWAFAVLVVLAVPLAAVWAYAISVREPGNGSPDRRDRGDDEPRR
jgi:hypothetical protein